MGLPLWGGSGGCCVQTCDALPALRPHLPADYFRLVLQRRGPFTSDNALADSPLTRPLVERYSADQPAFFQDFSDSLLFMGAQGAALKPYQLAGLNQFGGPKPPAPPKPPLGPGLPKA